MKVTWRGEACLLFANDKITVLVDPFLSDDGGRRYPADKSYLEIKPDVIVLTHSHPSHTDVKTLSVYLEKGNITVLCGEEAYNLVLTIADGNNPVLLAPHSVYSINGVTFYAVKAEHTDRTAIGVIIDDGEKTYYVSGDTLYNFDVIDDVLDLAPDGVDYAFLPINGRGGNMNAKDAADFAYEIDAGKAIPVHYGLFDNVDAKEFDFEDAWVLTPYKEENFN